MAERITTYTPETAVEILRRLNRLEQRQNALLSGGLTQSFPQSVLPTRWARTCTTSDHPTYPTSGNVVMVELGDYEPSPLSPGSTAAKVFTAYDPRYAVEATGDNSPLPFEGQVVAITWRNGKWWYLHPNFRRATADVSISAGSSGLVSLFDDSTDMGSRTAYYTWGDDGGATIDAGDEIFVAWFDAEQRWVILPPAVAGTSTSVPTCILFNGNAYNGDSSSKNKLYYYGVSNSSNRVAYVHFISGWGDLAGVGVDVTATASSVGAGTHAATDASFKLTQGGLYRFIIGGQVSHDATKYEAVRTETGATASGGSPAHTHDYTYLQERVVRSSFVCDLQWRNAGGGAWQTTAEQMRCVSPMFDLFSMPVSGSRQDQTWQIEAIMWQNHDQVDREYRLRVTMSSEWDSFVSGGKFTQASFVADTGLIAITRLADYAADQTLTP